MPWSDSLIGDVVLVLTGPDDPLMGTSWLDKKELTLLHLSFDPEEERDPPGDDDPAWQHKEHADAARILADDERYVRIVPTGTPGRLHDFLRSIEDRELRDALYDAKRGGRGAYRRVRDVLQRRGCEHLWHEFEDEANQELAEEWLEENVGS